MAEERTLARPYAEAAFALAAGDYAPWSKALDSLAAIVANQDVARLVGNPRVERQELVAAILRIAGEAAGEQAGNLVRLLAENRRLPLLPAIAALFAALRAGAENRVDVEVRSALALDEAQQRRLAESLQTRLAREVNLACHQDPELIGGAVVRAGDMIIDGSVRAHLARLSQSLSH